MDPEPLLPAHLDYLTLKNQRPASILERRWAVLRTNERMGKPVAKATRQDLQAWQRTLTRLTPAGQHNEIVHTRQFIRWVVDAGHRDDDPTRVLVDPKNVHQQLPRPMSDADIGVAILTAPYPERAWFALMAFCGLRCMEIADMQRGWILDNQTPPLLRVIGKGGKHRTIPLPERVLAELLEAGIPSRGYCWARMDGAEGPPTRKRVSQRLNKHLQSCGITETAHALRHRFGTELWRATHDALLVARVMGHSSVDTTKGYVLISPDDAVQALDTISHLNTKEQQSPWSTS